MQVMRNTEQLAASGRVIGEFVPPSSYISGPLLQYLSRRNAALASRQIQVSANHFLLSKVHAESNPYLTFPPLFRLVILVCISIALECKGNMLSNTLQFETKVNSPTSHMGHR